ncbi:TIGR02281 family clan AA aspartic protease [Yoonia sp. BS5-3]|uniref:TIGR02281 family clan AA aspartic protease n=1 Tax=Yoonia phaeophyticola TaxID=3137369 RepID=A0ABZ2V255_9RHOB
MNTDQTMQFIYLVLLGAAIGGSALVAGRRDLGKTAQHAAIWALIFIGVIGAIGLWDDISRDVAARQTVMDDGSVSVPRGPDGHYYLTLTINDVPVEFVVDTGASEMVLTRRDAQRVGIDLNDLAYSGFASTANGIVTTAPVTLGTTTLGEMSDQNLPAVVNRGDMDMSLLGMTYLGLYDRIEIFNGELVLTR